MEENVISPPYHEHSLFLKENIGRNEKVDCYVCGNPIGDLEMTYICMVCDPNSIILHKECGELREQFFYPKRHHFHMHDSHSSRDRSKCDVCRGYLDKVGYKCCNCDFHIHTTCVNAFMNEGKELQHPSHPHHPLTLMRKPAFPFQCDGCDDHDVDMAYICSVCDFWLHKTCALLPATLPTAHHHHHLTLAFSFPEEHRKFDYKCDVCGKYFPYLIWLYYCGDCRYFIHVKCAGSTIKPASNSSGDHDDDDNDRGSDLIEFPLYENAISDKLIRNFVMREKGVDDKTTTSSNFILFKYHHHPLRLVWESEAADVELKICDACVTPISSSPYYECSASASCSYSIHSICYFLPNTIHSSYNSLVYGDCQKIPNQKHNFTLYALSKSRGRDAISYWKCDRCYLPTNGMGYKCEGCGMKIDVKCASLPISIKHASHRHHKPLHQRWYEYRCTDDGCYFHIPLRVVMLPKIIREREWDKDPLLLTSDASRDHPSDFFCEFCEKEMHPKGWMYHCRQCDASFHPDCLKNATGEYRNIKFGRRFELDGIHPNHPLDFTYITLKRHCDLCHKSVYTHLGLECASCYYVVCEECGCKELDKIS